MNISGSFFLPGKFRLIKLVSYLCDEYCRDCLVECRAIHVDGGAHWQQEVGDPGVDLVRLLHDFHRQRKRCLLNCGVSVLSKLFYINGALSAVDGATDPG